MKKRFLCLLMGVMIACMFSLSSCSLFESTIKTVKYKYNDETIYITVKKGSYYILDSIPEKFGYTFEGLFDANGKQHVSSQGESLTEFKEKEETLTLYVRFKPIQYPLNFDFGGASAASGGTITAEYDNTIPQLPANLRLEGKSFTGWYTMPDGKGLKVSGADGVSQVSVNEHNFDLENNKINLYAAFDDIMVTVTFRDLTGATIQTSRVSYGSNLSDVANSVRVNGLGVISWQGSVSGKVTKDTELVAKEYAPVIELDCRGGEGKREIIAREGSYISLPVPQKANNDFLYWESENGKEYTSSTMPKQSIKLRAVWQPKIVFDSNGGSSVNEIAKKAGASVTLPSPERTGFIFAGWFTEDGEPYSSKVMPEDGIALKAGWARIKNETFDLTERNNYVTNKSKFCKIDLQEYNPKNLKMPVHVKLHFQAQHFSGSSIVFDGFNDLIVGYYSQATTVQSYALCASKRLPHDKVKDYRIYNLEQDLIVTDGLFYVVFTNGSVNNGIDIKDGYAKIQFPDFANIEL